MKAYKNGTPKKYNDITTNLIRNYIVMTIICLIIGVLIYFFSRYRIEKGTLASDQALIVSLFFFLGMYLLVLVAFVLIISRQLNKPLTILREAIEAMDYDNPNHIEFEGPIEFKEIVDSFNDMSIRLNASIKENQRLNDEKNKMLADISHDLKTPLTVIQGYARALHDGLIREDQIQDYLKIISEKSTSVADLINQFHEYSKLEHPEFKFELEKLNVAEYIRELLVSKIDELYVNGFELEVNIPDNFVGYIKGNQTQLKRVFENLISNTCAHTPKGTLLSFDMGTKGKNVLIRYQDNGGGIPPEIGDRIFDPFVKEDTARHKAGSGLGLSIAKKIIEYHNGTIVLEKDVPMNIASYLITIPLYNDGSINNEAEEQREN